MSSTQSMLECVPNFSEGRDQQKLDRLARLFSEQPGVTLLDYSSDRDHNRSVYTLCGGKEALVSAMLAAIGFAIEEIDLRKHTGGHPRIGAVDVIPFIPLGESTLEEADQAARQLARAAAERYALPCYLYERSATAPHREDLAAIRRGSFEGLADKMRDPQWQPDFGPGLPHPTAGAAAIGARLPLIAYNIVLNTQDISIANAIARQVRASNSGLPCLKAIGVYLKQRGLAQVSMNLTDYTRTPLWQAYEAVQTAAAERGVEIVDSELIGLMPQQAAIDCLRHYLHIENIGADKILEMKISSSVNK